MISLFGHVILLFLFFFKQKSAFFCVIKVADESKRHFDHMKNVYCSNHVRKMDDVYQKCL